MMWYSISRRPGWITVALATLLALVILLPTAASAHAARKGSTASRLIDLDAYLACLRGGGADL